MPSSERSRRAGHHPAPIADHGFDDEGFQIAIVQPDFGDAGDVASQGPKDMLEVLTHGVLHILEGGHRDAIPTRAAALGRCLRIYSSDAAAAASLGLHRSTVTRAVRRMRQKLKRSLNPPKK